MAQRPLDPCPPITQLGFDTPQWRDWLFRLAARVRDTGQILWSQLDFTGSNITSILTRNHNDLQNIQGGASADYYHWTEQEKQDERVRHWITVE